jgi:hypothetical protein
VYNDRATADWVTAGGISDFGTDPAPLPLYFGGLAASLEFQRKLLSRLVEVDPPAHRAVVDRERLNALRKLIPTSE